MRNVSDKSCRENQNTHFMFNNFFFRKSCWVGDNVEKCDGARQATDDNIIRHMCFACWINKATHTDTHTLSLFLLLSEYIILLLHSKSVFAKAQKCYGEVLTLPLLLSCTGFCVLWNLCLCLCCLLEFLACYAGY